MNTVRAPGDLIDSCCCAKLATKHTLVVMDMISLILHMQLQTSEVYESFSGIILHYIGLLLLSLYQHFWAKLNTMIVENTMQMRQCITLKAEAKQKTYNRKEIILFFSYHIENTPQLPEKGQKTWDSYSIDSIDFLAKWNRCLDMGRSICSFRRFGLQSPHA